MNYTQTLFYHDAHYWVWTGYNGQADCELICAYHKTGASAFEVRAFDAPVGVRHLIYVQRGKNGLGLQRIEDMVRLTGRFSHRPYRPGPASDGAAGACVFALYIHFCRMQGIFPAAVFHDAYPDMAWEDESQVMGFARWQGVALPVVWTAQTFGLLLESLAKVNHHCLGDRLAWEVRRRSVYGSDSGSQAQAA